MFALYNLAVATTFASTSANYQGPDDDDEMTPLLENSYDSLAPSVQDKEQPSVILTENAVTQKSPSEDDIDVFILTPYKVFDAKTSWDYTKMKRSEAMVFPAFKQAHEDVECDSNDEFPLNELSTAHFKIILKFFEMQKIEPMNEIEKPMKDNDIYLLVQHQYAEFINSMSVAEVVDLTLSANYAFNGKHDLITLCLARVASIIKSAESPEQLGQEFGLNFNELPEEEQKQIKAEWDAIVAQTN
jgi:hypothetical protein